LENTIFKLALGQFLVWWLLFNLEHNLRYESYKPEDTSESLFIKAIKWPDEMTNSKAVSLSLAFYARL
jgi:hypothetical protein